MKLICVSLSDSPVFVVPPEVPDVADFVVRAAMPFRVSCHAAARAVLRPTHTLRWGTSHGAGGAPMFRVVV